MKFKFENYYEESFLKFKNDPRPDKDLPKPDYPESKRHEEVNFYHDNGELILIKDGLFTDTQLSDSLREATILDNDRLLIERGVREVGIDALAFYKSYRYINEMPHKGKWGIFYYKKGLISLQNLIQSKCPNCANALALAYEFLQVHERYHFKFDLYALSIESHMKVGLYHPLHRAFRNHQIYLVEEALANRDVLDWANKNKKNKPTNFKDFVTNYMKLQPGAYARFDEDKYELAGELAANLIDLNLNKSARRMDQAHWVSQLPPFLFKKIKYCPEYLISD